MAYLLAGLVNGGIIGFTLFTKYSHHAQILGTIGGIILGGTIGCCIGVNKMIKGDNVMQKIGAHVGYTTLG